MDLPNILRELHDQLDALNISILALERVVAAKGPRRGRPPKWMKEAKAKEARPRAAAKAPAKGN
jgi:hypothetical protein